MANILVTGGAGFIGSHTVIELLEAGHNPVIIDNFSNSEQSVIDRLEKLAGKSLRVYVNDYQDVAKLEQILEQENIDGVIHFAAYKAVGESVEVPLKYYENNVAGLITLLKTIVSSHVKNFVFSSSCTVYGDPDMLPVTEDSPVKPAVSPYGASKQMDEIIIKDTLITSKTLKAVALRYFNPIGAHPSALIGELPKGVPANLIPYVTQTAAGLRDELTIHGDDYPTPDGSCIRDYIHVVDLAKAHVKAIEFLNEKPASFYDTVNIGTGTGSSVLEVISTFQEVTGVKVPYTIGPRRKGDVMSTYASVDKAKAELGWQAEKTLANALEDAWRWQQALEKFQS
jgi:UDP-glucose 4-epimerase